MYRVQSFELDANPCANMALEGLGRVALCGFLLAAAAAGCSARNPLFSPLDASAPLDAPRDREPPGRDVAPGEAAPAEVATPEAGMESDGGSDAGPAVDARVEAGPPDGPPADATAVTDGPPDAWPAGCGMGRANLTGVVEADGIAVAKDGTLYFSSADMTQGWIGRIRPDQAPQVRWVPVPRAEANWGLALDEERRRLFLASASEASIRLIDLSVNLPTTAVFKEGLIEPNDLALTPDGSLYYSLQSDRHIYRIPLGGAAVLVTRTPLGDAGSGQAPSAIAFAPDGALVVGLRSGGAIYRLALENHRETARTTFGMFSDWVNGLAFDRAGRLYVGTYSNTAATRLLRIDGPDAPAVELLAGGSYAGMAFGRGTLDCRDLYLADPTGPMRRLFTDVPGLPLP